MENKSIKRLTLLASTFLCATQMCLAQRSTDLGLFLGASSYYGDINRTKAFYSPFPAIGIIGRRTYNDHYSLKGMGAITQLTAEDSDFSAKSGYKELRNYEMDNNTVIDFIAQVEYNFFPISYKMDKDNISPYVHAGLGAFFALETSPILQVSIPVGAGVKFKLTEKLELRAEYIFHKTFTDNLDNAIYERNQEPFKFRQLAEKNNKDNFAIYGISLLYTVKRDKVQCPVFDKKL